MKTLLKIISSSCLAALISLGLSSCAAARPPIVPPKTPPPPLTLKAVPRVALALGGGGARGMAHIGVLKVLEEQQIPIDLIVGTSAGNIVGAMYADDPDAKRLQTIFLQAGLFNILDISPSLEGAVAGYQLQSFILKHTHARNFSQLKMPFVSVTTDLKTGATVPISSGPLAPAVNASAALPPVFHPVNLYGKTLVDGGVSDLIPADIAKQYHPEILIAVNIISDIPPGNVPDNIISIYNRAYLLADAKFADYNMRDADVRIHPLVGQAGLFDDSNADKLSLVRAGERAAKQALPQICALLRARQIPSKCS